ncbi:hypothetical protein [Aureibacter tunicatorum]|uniref:DUF4397 domain-containing protein n=1 Tax=Aureibacter tunicatorum TaxID=866807 RepID=A0AAE3XQV6_9BACT|nr:hypothetical protein [Aureibacter tunicatorum]MDR6241472.1 hypothetical protein [Aureibacter tunicatorum]BDD06685.1 hypothetical protein AUTU_41680 [Aureibacter tunicatorum]
MINKNQSSVWVNSILALCLIFLFSCQNSDDATPNTHLKLKQKVEGLAPGQYANIPFAVNRNLRNAKVKVYMNDSLVQEISTDTIHYDSLKVSHMVPLQYAGQNVQYQIALESNTSAADITSNIYFDVLVYNAAGYKFVVDNRTTLNINFYNNRVSFQGDHVLVDDYFGFASNGSDNSKYDVTVNTAGQFVYNNKSASFSYSINLLNHHTTYMIRVPKSLINTSDINTFIETAYNVAQTAKQETHIQWADIADFNIFIVHQDGRMGVFTIENDFVYDKNIKYRGIKPS